jgi:ABC-2 type transport system permease protein
METWVDLFWFSLIDILIYGLIRTFFVTGNTSSDFLIAGVIVWEIVRVGQYTVSVGILWEIWSRSFSSLFISPLTLWEFIAGQVISGLGKSIAVTVIISLVAALLFGFNVFQLSPLSMLIYFAIGFTFSIAAGMFVLSLIIRFGTNIQSLAWGMIFLVQPFSAIFYPVEVLPPLMRPFSYLSPVTYVMQSVRSELSGAGMLVDQVVIGAFAAVLYLAATIWFVNRVLKQAKESGVFARMEN